MSDLLHPLNWQPWRLDDLTPESNFAPVVPDIGPEEALSPGDAILNSQELADLRRQLEQQSRQVGFEQGQQEGYQAGYQRGIEEGRKQGLEDARQQHAPLIAQWQQLLTDFQQELDTLDSVIPARLMQLALTAARQVIGQTPASDSSALLNLIRKLIEQEPLFSGKPLLRVHPDTLATVQTHLGDSLNALGWTLLADSQLHPGGCKISAEDGELDASLSTRWRELCRLAVPGEQ